MIAMIKELIKNKKILILGYGREGRSSWQRIKEAGGFASIAIADQNEIKLEAGHPARLIFGPDYQACLNEYDVVFKSPGIVLVHAIETYQCEIVSQTELFFRRFASQCIGITGTKGKSTTTTLIYHILKTAGKNCVLVGNIGIPMFDRIDEISEDTLIVCELSCHQLEYVTCAPQTGVLLNIHEEHLDHYGTMEKYVAAKENIYRKQRVGDKIVCSSDFLPQPGTCVSTVIPVSDGRSMEQDEQSIILLDHTIKQNNHQYEIPTKAIPLIGHHNYVDIAFAYEVCCVLFGVSDSDFTKALISYEPLPHRLQYIGTFGGVRYYDDSISTICDTTIQALISLPDTAAVLIGGMDRGIDYTDLINFLARSSVPHIILMEATGQRIMRELQQHFDFGSSERIRLVPHLAEAVAEAKKVCQPGTCCVLSPAAASYGIFKNFEERGDEFRRLVIEINEG